jgi:GNAT superfamily N-acetyltransferase
MPIPDVRLVPVTTRAELKEFVTFPWRVYRDDPNWVPPLIGDTMKMFDAAKHPFHEHAEVQCFLARRGPSSGRESGQVVGRIAAIVNRLHNEFHGEKTGFFGFFDTVPDAGIPPVLFRAAADWLGERGMDRMRGPASFSSNEEWGLLVDGFDRPPMVMMTYNPPAYARYLEDFGFLKAKDLVAYYMSSDTPIPERLVRALATTEGPPVTVRTLDMKHYLDDVGKVRDVYNAAWEKNWGFVPMTPAEIDHLAAELKPVVDPDFVAFAECEGKTVGFSLVLPDANRALKAANGRLFPFGLVRMLIEQRRIREVRVLILGVVPEYRRRRIDMMLYNHIWRTALRKGIVGGEFSWILEDNLLIRRALERLGARVYKIYRLYDYPLTP